MHALRLWCDRHDFWVDVRVAGLNGRCIASADTPKGPSLGPPRRRVAPLSWPTTIRTGHSRAAGHATADLLDHRANGMNDSAGRGATFPPG